MNTSLFRRAIGPVMLAGLFGSVSAFGNVILDNQILDNTFPSNQASGCPTGWTCSGSPTPGFTSYKVTSNEYPGGFSPRGGNAATAPTFVEGSGSLSQSGIGGLTYMAGQTYTLDLWVGTPMNVPAIGGVAPGTPAAMVGTITVYFTSALGVGLGDGAFSATIPTPGTWTLETFNFTPSAGDVGDPVGIELFVDSTPVGGGSGNNRIANFQIGSVPEPASLMLVGLGIAGLGLLRRKRSA